MLCVAYVASWGKRIRAWSAGGMPDDVATLCANPPPVATPRNVFCFFDNTMKIHAPENALKLARWLRLDAQLRIPG